VVRVDAVGQDHDLSAVGAEKRDLLRADLVGIVKMQR